MPCPRPLPATAFAALHLRGGAGLHPFKDSAAAAAIALYRSEVVFKVGAMAPAESAWPVDTSDPPP